MKTTNEQSYGNYVNVFYYYACTCTTMQVGYF